MAKGLISEPPKRNQKQPNRQARQDAKAQKQFVRQQQQGDRAIQSANTQGLSNQVGFSNEQFKGVQDAYSKPFDLSFLGDVPKADQAYMDTVRDSYLKQYDYANAENDKRALSDFEQMAGERGWMPNTEVYNRQKELLLKGQRGARDNAVNAAIQNAGAEGQRMFDMQMQGRGTQRDEYVAGRDRPFQEWSAGQGVINQNPYWNQRSQESQQGFQAAEGQKDRDLQWKVANMNRGGGGGGGGGGAAWQQYGFSSPQEYDQYRMNQGLAAKEAELKLGQKYGPKQANPYAQVGGGILGSFANSFASGLGGSMFGTGGIFGS